MNPRAAQRAQACVLIGRDDLEVELLTRELHGKRFLAWLLDEVHGAGVERIVLALSERHRQLLDSFPDHRIEGVVAPSPGQALSEVVADLEDADEVLLLMGSNAPLVRRATLRTLYSGLAGSTTTDSVCVSLDALRAPPCARFYALTADSLTGILRTRIDLDPAAAEPLLSNILDLIAEKGGEIRKVTPEEDSESFVVEGPRDLPAASKLLRDRIADRWIIRGVDVMDPDTTHIEDSVVLEPGSKIFPGVVLQGMTRVGRRAQVRSYSHLRNAVIGDDTVVDHCSVIRECKVDAKCRVGPFAHLRQGAAIGASVRVGNFVEVKNSIIGDRTQAAHLSYLGDAKIGKDVNVGAGTITCNYDGRHKHRTTIEDEAFVGSNSQLIAPVVVGEGSTVAAGSTITEDVPPRSLAIARSRQVNKVREEGE